MEAVLFDVDRCDMVGEPHPIVGTVKNMTISGHLLGIDPQQLWQAITRTHTQGDLGVGAEVDVMTLHRLESFGQNLGQKA